MKSSSGLPALGVDLVEYDKAKRFYLRHRLRLGAFLSPSEARYVRSGRGPAHRRLADLLAAKEAVLKAGSLRWAGPWAFRSVRISACKGRFRARAASGMAPVRALTVTRRGKYVVARCLTGPVL